MKDIFLGNDSAKLMLKNIVKTSKISHAYLIHGQAGLGKKTFANMLVMSVLCTNLVDGEPCFECSNCRKILENNHPDVFVLHGSAVQNSIHIEQIRQIRSDCAIKPNEAKTKVYLISNAQSMTIGAMNAFLKTLEEPPQNTLFILTATGVDALPQTVVSRLMLIPLFPIGEEVLKSELTLKFADMPQDEIQMAINYASGNFGKAMDALTDDKIKNFIEELKLISNSITQKKEYEILKLLNNYEKDKPKLMEVLDFLKSEFRKILLFKENVINSESINQELAMSITKKQCTDLIEFLEIAKKKLGTNANYNLMIAYICCKIKQIID